MNAISYIDCFCKHVAHSDSLHFNLQSGIGIGNLHFVRCNLLFTWHPISFFSCVSCILCLNHVHVKQSVASTHFNTTHCESVLEYEGFSMNDSEKIEKSSCMYIHISKYCTLQFGLSVEAEGFKGIFCTWEKNSEHSIKSLQNVLVHRYGRLNTKILLNK